MNGKTIRELEELTGFSARSIHHYISRGLLPGAQGSGPAARYGKEHLLRLKLIEQAHGKACHLFGVCLAVIAPFREVNDAARARVGPCGAGEELAPIRRWKHWRARPPGPSACGALHSGLGKVLPIFQNTIFGDLECGGNSPPPSLSDNDVAGDIECEE